jgi:hypothetical protein
LGQRVGAQTEKQGKAIFTFIGGHKAWELSKIVLWLPKNI